MNALNLAVNALGNFSNIINDLSAAKSYYLHCFSLNPNGFESNLIPCALRTSDLYL